jgi:hypothetical protein
MWSSRWIENWQGKPKYSEKTRPNSTLSITNPILRYLGWIPGFRSENRAAVIVWDRLLMDEPFHEMQEILKQERRV